MNYDCITPFAQKKLILCVALLHREAKAQTGPIAGFIRTNLIGHPVIHDKVSYVSTLMWQLKDEDNSFLCMEIKGRN
ncbi:hypothetical protein HW555_006713 [Spodoptera exigua]|uniref:Uncharacterized protein n=1 Tax=Spodoptera exigua TaxID=7107 RepID=A0A835GI62_SPOEX|nr:hypothetical protein HW555_006713 [Spodoptera exigua]